ncbi:MAG TPA: hypothetical protein VF161_11225 [Steroidobacteraceae bacterium]
MNARAGRIGACLGSGFADEGEQLERLAPRPCYHAQVADAQQEGEMAWRIRTSAGKRRVLIAVCVLCACLMIVEVIASRRIRALDLGIWQLELVMLPWIVFVGSVLGTVATSWFDSEAGSQLFRRVVSLLVAAGVLGLVTMTYFGLVF